MDHITRCPNCSTAFRVTEEQLAAYHGQVRCGRCALVFNARDCLLPSPPAEPVSAASINASDEHPQVKQAIEQAVEQTNVQTAETAEHEAQTPAANSIAAPEQAQIDQPNAQTFQAEAPDALMETAPETPEQVVQAQAAGYRPIALPEDDALFAPLPKPRHRATWIIATLLAALALFLQLVFAYRMTLAMEFPALQPRFTRLCNALGCSMPLPRQAEQLRMEWSELTYVPDHPTLIQLSATLRNLAQYEQALPLLELTLTDNQERVVARRVFKPAEYLTSNEKNRQSLLGHDEMRAFLQLETRQLKSTGYSLYWFY